MALKTVTLGDGVLIQFPATHGRTLVTIRERRLVAVDDKCAHRGGPIHLSHEGEDGCWRCPWHDKPVKRDRSSKQVSAVYFPATGKVNLVAVVPGDREWPLRSVAASRETRARSGGAT